MKRYYVVWIPMSAEAELSVIKEFFGPVCERDIPSLKGVVFEGQIDPATFDVSVKYYEEEGDVNHLEFTCEHSDPKGFLTFSLELDGEDFLAQDLQTHLPSCIYNFIKGFFHEHKWHDSGEDSILPSFCYDSLVDFSLTSERSFIVNELLDAYYAKFEGHLESWNDALVDLNQKILLGSKPYDDLFALLERVTDSYNVCGELGYCEFLLANFKNEIGKAKRKDLRKLMASILRTSSDMRTCYDRYIAIVSLNDGRNSKIFGWIGFALSLLSIALTLLSIWGVF